MLPDIGLKPHHNRLSNTDPGCYLSLGKSGFSSGLQDLVEELEFLSECIIFTAHVGACKRPGFESFKCIPHLSPLSCASARRGEKGIAYPISALGRDEAAKHSESHDDVNRFDAITIKIRNAVCP
jgi:hypothetical protein